MAKRNTEKKQKNSKSRNKKTTEDLSETETEQDNDSLHTIDDETEEQQERKGEKRSNDQSEGKPAKRRRGRKAKSAEEEEDEPIDSLMDAKQNKSTNNKRRQKSSSRSKTDKSRQVIQDSLKQAESDSDSTEQSNAEDFSMDSEQEDDSDEDYFDGGKKPKLMGFMRRRGRTGLKDTDMKLNNVPFYEDLIAIYSGSKPYNKLMLLSKFTRSLFRNYNVTLHHLVNLILVLSDVYLPSEENTTQVQPFLASPLEKVAETFLQSVDQLQAANTNNYSVFLSKSVKNIGKGLKDLALELAHFQREKFIDNPSISSFISILTQFSKSKIRSLRYVSTFFLYMLSISALEMTTMIDKEINVRSKQLNMQSSYTKAVDSLESLKQAYFEFHHSIYMDVFLHRIRDIFEGIRQYSIYTLYQWILLSPSTFISNDYLKYLGWGLFDSAALNRFTTIFYIRQLYAHFSDQKALVAFIKKYLDRLIYMTRDVEPMVIMNDLLLLNSIQSILTLQEDQKQIIDELTFDTNCYIRRYAYQFLHSSLYSNTSEDSIDKEVYLSNTLNFLIQYETEEDPQYSYIHYYIDACFPTLSAIYQHDYSTIINTLIHNNEHLSTEKLHLLMVFFYHLLHLYTLPPSTFPSISHCYILGTKKDFPTISYSLPDPVSSILDSISMSFSPSFITLLTTYKANEECLLYLLKLFLLLDLNLLIQSSTVQNSCTILVELFTISTNSEVLDLLSQMIERMMTLKKQDADVLVTLYTTIEDYFQSLLDEETMTVQDDIDAPTFYSYCTKLISLYRYNDLSLYISPPFLQNMNLFLQSIPLDVQNESILLSHLSIYKILMLHQMWQMTKNQLDSSMNLLSSIKEDWSILINYYSSLSQPDPLFSTYVLQFFPLFFDYLIVLEPSIHQHLHSTDSLFSQIYILLHACIQCSIPEEESTSTESLVVQAQKHRLLKTLLIPLSKAVRVYYDTSLSCSLFHYFTYFSHETTELCRYVLNTFKSISYHLTVQAIYFHIFHSYSYWINGFKETFEDQDGYLYIKRSILIARKMTVSFGLVAKNPLLIQALQSFSCMGIDYGLSEVPSTFGFFDYLYVLTSKLTIEDRSSIATYLNDKINQFDSSTMENYQKYASIFLMNSKSQETNSIPNDWRALLEYQHMLVTKKPTPMVEDSSIESAEDHS